MKKRTFNWERVGGRSDLPPAVDWDDTRVVEGIMKAIRDVDFGDRITRVAEIELESGDVVSVWETKGLVPLFELRPPIPVRIEFQGFKKSKSGRKFRAFDIYADFTWKPEQ
jgi:hypothetical protein